VKTSLLLVGFGHVARRFVALLDESRDALALLDVDPVIVGVVTRRLGSLYDDAGLDAARLSQWAIERTTSRQRSSDASLSPVECIARLRSRSAETRVLVETTTLDIRSGEPAVSHVRAGFAAGAHVITANKGPVACAYRTLAREAAEAGVSFLFEGAVMDGVPIFNLVRETMPAVTVRGFRGVVNSTTNFMLTALERGESFDVALARMQAEGVAEADPSLDIDGWDAAAKTSALANVLLDAELTPALVPREPLEPATAVRAAQALADGRRLKLIARANGRGRDVRASVSLESLPLDDPLAQLPGQGNALELDTWPLGRIVITQRDGGLEKTAYALLSDLVTVAKRVRG
jgi:homoserine dehydrogenase